jgi:hypothetical protein
VQACRGAGEAALLGDGEKGFELKQVHRVPLVAYAFVIVLNE